MSRTGIAPWPAPARHDVRARGRRAVFLDKDGTLIENVEFNVNPARVRLMPTAGPALVLLQAGGYQLFVITNQSGIARGYFDEAGLQAARDAIDRCLAVYGVALSGFYYCPHLPPEESANADQCDCRKPQPGLIRRAAREHALDLSRSWLFGDILDDVEAGRRAGCRTILIGSPAELNGRYPEPDLVAADLMKAAGFVLQADGGQTRTDSRITGLPGRRRPVLAAAQAPGLEPPESGRR